MITKKEVFTDEPTPPICLHVLGQGLVNELYKEAMEFRKQRDDAVEALKAIAYNVRISVWLGENHPKVIGQVASVINKAEGK